MAGVTATGGRRNPLRAVRGRPAGDAVGPCRACMPRVAVAVHRPRSGTGDDSVLHVGPADDRGDRRIGLRGVRGGQTLVTPFGGRPTAVSFARRSLLAR